MSTLPKVLIVGGPDVDARLELMHSLSDRFEMSALGSQPSLHHKFASEGFRYYSYSLSRNTNPLGDLKSLFQLFAIFRKVQPKIVHTFDTKPSIWGRLVARLAGVPVVIGTLPGLGSLYVNDSFKSRVLRSVYEELQRLSSGVSDLTIFQNEDDARQFIQAGIVPTQKAMVILGSGINTNQFSPARISEVAKTQLKTEFNIQPDEIVVTMISRIIRSKGVFEFMQSAREIQKTNPKVRFLLIGGDDQESMDRLTEQEMQELRQAVDWRGQRSDVPTILAISDIFVLPSVYREGIPRALLEAAAMQLPIITTDTPGCKDVVENGRNGFLVPPRDAQALSRAIETLVKEPETCRRFGQASRQRAVQKFDMTVTFGQMRSAYDHSFLLSGEKSKGSPETYISKSKTLQPSGSSIVQSISIFGMGLVKRSFDIIMSLIGLLFLTPLFVYIVAKIKRDSPGPAFYWGSRMGRNGKPFKILKFRTMYEDQRSYMGPSVTAQGDDRITPLGHWLRDTKINELPQLWNVLIGEMSLVGPRPEDVKIAETWPADVAKEILSVRPGITSPASILYHEEERLLSSTNLMEDYFKNILPDKIRLDRLYIRYHSFFSDIDIIFWTLAILIPNIAKTSISEGHIFSGPFSVLVRQHVRWFTLDLATSLVAVTITGLLWRLDAPLEWGLSHLATLGVLMAFLFSSVNSIFGVNKVVWAKAHFEDAIGLVFSCSFSTVVILVFNYLQSFYNWLPFSPLTPIVVLTAGLLAGIGFLIVRYRLRLVTAIANTWLSLRKNNVSGGERVIIAGEGEGTQIASWLMQRQMFRNAFSVVGMVNQMDPTTYGMKVDGLWMLGSIHDLPVLLKKNDIGVILSTLPRNSDESEFLFALTKDSPTRIIFLNDLMWIVDQQVTRPMGHRNFSLRLEERVEFNSLNDSLTELPNGAIFQDRLRHALANARRNMTRNAIVFVELEGLYLIPDDLGRKTLLKAAAHRLNHIKREVDALSRFNGDMYALLFENVLDNTQLDLISKRIVSEMSKPFDVQGRQIKIEPKIHANMCTSACAIAQDPKNANIKQCNECVRSQKMAVMSDAIL
jgi:diguanylate cyclase (GGDEF)-like protein